MNNTPASSKKSLNKPDGMSGLIVPVLDIMAGQVVRAAGGRRAEYAPLVSPLTNSSDPVALVEALERVGYTRFYVADLDAITGAGSAQAVIETLAAVPSREIWLDGGYKTPDDAPQLTNVTPIFATETLTRWETVETLENAIVSIDTKDGKLLSPLDGMTVDDILRHARRAGARRFIHIRLEAVGAGGFAEGDLIPPGDGEEWYAGGGVRGRADVERAVKAGYAGALVSTAIHSGKI